MHGYVTRSVRLAAVPMLLAGVVGGVAPVTAAAARSRSTGPAASFTIRGQLSGVAAVSARSAWAVGFTGSKALIVHWNGTAWKQVPSPNPAGSPLFAVAAVSARSAWAVGCSSCEGGPNKTQIERWNGTAWKHVPSPSPKFSELTAVAAASARRAWAVGATFATSGTKTLILRWNGTTWK